MTLGLGYPPHVPDLTVLVCSTGSVIILGDSSCSAYLCVILPLDSKSLESLDPSLHHSGSPQHWHLIGIQWMSDWLTDWGPSRGPFP